MRLHYFIGFGAVRLQEYVSLSVSLFLSLSLCLSFSRCAIFNNSLSLFIDCYFLALFTILDHVLSHCSLRKVFTMSTASYFFSPQPESRTISSFVRLILLSLLGNTACITGCSSSSFILWQASAQALCQVTSSLPPSVHDPDILCFC